MTNDTSKDIGTVIEEQDAVQEELSEESNEIEVLKNKVLDVDNQYRRALADYQNLQRRVQEERIQWLQSANKDLLLKFLPVLDILILAAKHLNDKGLELSIQQFLDVLEKEGVKKFETGQKKFDPHVMECIETVEGKEDFVIEEVRAGYLFHEKVLRTAQVKVGKK